MNSAGSTIKTKDFALKISDLGDDGTFEGYGSIFGNVDSYGEKVARGAFRESLARHKAAGTKPLLLWQHDSWAPIGVWDDLIEDEKGLWGKGRLLSGVKAADEALILLRNGAIQGLSIGYREIEVEPEANIRVLKRLDLMEISIVSFPANQQARIESVKSVTGARDIEEMLRAAGVSSRKAKAAASAAWKSITQTEDETAAEADLAAILKASSARIARIGLPPSN
jgi:uncharacterized protein